jgi:hypothetical protein
MIDSLVLERLKERFQVATVLIRRDVFKLELFNLLQNLCSMFNV